jgi:hypothetical protein
MGCALPEVGKYVTITGKLGHLVAQVAGNGPYLVQSIRPHEDSNIFVLRISGNLGSAAVYYPNSNLHPSEPPNHDWRDYGF